MHSDPIINYFSNFMSLETEEKEAIQNYFKERRIKRRQFILQEGDICSLNTFVVEGCFRMYILDDKGKEHNIQFAVENWWIGDLGSFYSEKPSKLYIEAIENSIILQIKKEDQLDLFVNHPKFNRIFRVFTENALIAAQTRILQNIGSTAEQRYLDFTQRYPFFFNRISNVQIASFLGITPEFMSTLRKKIVKP